MITRRARTLAVAALAVWLSACADALAPSAIQSQPDASLMAAVVDAHDRLAPTIQNAGVRDRVLYDLGQIKDAVTAGNTQKAKYHVNLASGILYDYRTQSAATATDGPDVAAVALALAAVSRAVGGTFDMGTFH